MYDINFFSALKKKKTGNKGLIVLVILIVVAFIVLNGGLIAANYLLTSNMQKDIDEKKAYLNNPEIKQKLEEANQVSAEVDLTSQYLALLQQADDKRNQITLVDTALLDHIRSLTPLTTNIIATTISGNVININCIATVETDPIDMYHAFLHDDTFTFASLSSVTMQITEPEPSGSPAPTETVTEPTTETSETITTYSFNIQAILATGGDQE